jgi:hypothetical protein
MHKDNRPIDVSWARRSKRKKGKKRKKVTRKLAGLWSAAPQALRSTSIASRTATRARGFVSGGLPSLGKRK